MIVGMLPSLAIIPSPAFQLKASAIFTRDFDELLEGNPSGLLPAALGLKHYDWLSYQYMASKFHDSADDFSDVTEVK